MILKRQRDSLSHFEGCLAYLNFQVKGMVSMDEVKPYIDAIGRFFDAHELDAGGIAAIQSRIRGLSRCRVDDRSDHREPGGSRA
jgi:hypothetical protein